MKALLLKDVYNLGRAGDVKKVADGYARNFLIPQKMAVIASAGALRQIEKIQAAAAKQRELLNEILAANTGQPLTKIQQDTERDYFMSSEQAKEYGLVDAIMARRGSGGETAR